MKTRIRLQAKPKSMRSQLKPLGKSTGTVQLEIDM